MSTRAKWTGDIPDLYADLRRAATYLTAEQVSDLTGFSVNTITDLLSRKPITLKNNPLGPLSRPEARVGTKPLYSRRQVEQAIKRRDAGGGDRFLGGGNQPLPKVSHERAEELGYISVDEIAFLADVHEQTVRKWASRERSFPAAVAVRDRQRGHSGVPFVVRPHKAVEQWLIGEGKITTEEAAQRWTRLKAQAVRNDEAATV